MGSRSDAVPGPAASFGWVKDPEDHGQPVTDPETYPLVEEAVRRLDGGETPRIGGLVA